MMSLIRILGGSFLSEALMQNVGNLVSGCIHIPFRTFFHVCMHSISISNVVLSKKMLSGTDRTVTSGHILLCNEFHYEFTNKSLYFLIFHQALPLLPKPLSVLKTAETRYNCLPYLNNIFNLPSCFCGKRKSF